MTNDYIRRRDAVSRISDLLVFELKMTRCPTWNEVYNAIGELPSADVVQVVRCKDCKYNATTHKCLNPDSFFLIPKDDDFCSYGEKREE